MCAVPGREQEFRQSLDLAVRFAKALDCRRYWCESYSGLVFDMHEEQDLSPTEGCEDDVCL